MRSALLGLALTAGLARTGNAQTDSSQSLFLNQLWRPPGTQRCVVNEMTPLPVDQVIDSAAVLAGLSGLTRGSFVIAIRHAGSDTALARSHRRELWTPIRDTIAVLEARGDTSSVGLGQLLQQQLRSDAPPAFFLMRIDIGPGVTFRTAHSTFCPATPRDDSQLRRAASDIASSGVRQLNITISVLVQVDGTVSDVRLDGSTTRLELDQLLRQAIRATRFYPSLIDRMPIANAIRVPIRSP